MKRAKTIWMAICLCLILTYSVFTQSPDPAYIIDQVSVNQGKLSTQIVLQTKSPPSLFSTYYSDEHPATIVADLGEATVNINQPYQIEGHMIVESIIVEVNEKGHSRLLFPLRQKIPYRLYTSQNATIIELNTYLKDRRADFVPPDIKKQLQNTVGKSNYLKNVDVKKSENRIDIKAKLNGEAIVDIFALENPYRLVADFYNTINDLKIPAVEINKEGIINLRISQLRITNPGPITRLVFDLEEPRPYSMTSEKNNFSISFNTTPEKPAVEEDILESEIPKSEEPPSLETAEDENLEIEENPIEIKPIIISFVEEKKLNIQTEDKKPDIQPEEKKLKIQSEEMKPDIQTEEKKLNIQTEEKKLKIQSEEMKPDIQTNPPLSIEITEKSTGSSTAEPTFAKQTIGYIEEIYTGELVDIKFKDADLRDVVFYLGSEVAKLNVVFDPGVSGTITCDFVAVPWDQALDILLKNNRMGRTIEGNILRVAPIDVLTGEKEDKIKILASKEFTEPILIRRYPLSYALAEDVNLLIASKLSERGEIIVDVRTNTLIISDITDRIDIMEELIISFDKASPQVTIEARIVEATTQFVRNLGIQWGWRGISDPFYGNQTSLQFPNKVLVDGGLIPQGVSTRGIGGALGGYAINLPAPAFNSVMGLSLSNVLDTFGLDMALTALESSGNGKVISRPIITTQNNTQAEIIQGKQIPVQTSANFTVTTTFINAALELRVKPQITEENTIIMYIEIRNNSPDFGNLVNGIPPITMQSAQTTVMIPDGGTTVIGGIYQTDNSVTRDKVPLLHKIPLLGNLFRSTSRIETSRELLIFITPKIIK